MTNIFDYRAGTPGFYYPEGSELFDPLNTGNAGIDFVNGYMLMAVGELSPTGVSAANPMIGNALAISMGYETVSEAQAAYELYLSTCADLLSDLNSAKQSLAFHQRVYDANVTDAMQYSFSEIMTMTREDAYDDNGCMP